MSIKFPKDEEVKRKQIEKLMEDWLEYCKSKDLKSFTSDGFYPYYWQQPIRVLVIGRESRGLSDIDYIECLMNENGDGYRNSKIGGRSINQVAFHRRLMYVIYGIMKGYPSYDEIPYASDICKSVGVEGGISFAFMNLSKISNEGEKDYSTNYKTLGDFFEISTSGDRNFIMEEISLLSPQVIISMNMENRLSHILRDRIVEQLPAEKWSKKWQRWIKGIYTFTINEESQKGIWIDAYHFSALRGFTDKGSFYGPICSAVCELHKH